MVEMARHPSELLLKVAIHMHMTPAEKHLNRDTRLELGGCLVKAERQEQLNESSTH